MELIIRKEIDTIPGNPYSASKSAQESIARAYANTYKLPVIITNTMNVIGERQHPEKFVPLVIRKVLNGEKVSIHSNKDKTRAGQRFYIHARNVANAVHFIMEETDELLDNVDASKGVFNVVGEKELDNLNISKNDSRKRLVKNLNMKWLIFIHQDQDTI